MPMIRTFIFLVIYFTIGCVFALAFAALADDIEEGAVLAFAMLSILLWPAFVTFAIVMFVLRLIRGFR